MANYQFSSDLVDDILDRAGEPTDGSSDFDSQALKFLNKAYQRIWAGGSELDPEIDEIWWWLRKDSQGVLTLNPTIETGTVAITNNSATVTFSSGPTPSVVGRHFKIDGHADVFIISAHTATQTAATLESVYTGDTNSAASYTVFQVDYTLATDVLYLISPMFAYQDGDRAIEGMELSILKIEYLLSSIHTGVPRKFSMIGEQKVRMSHAGGTSSTDLIKVDYEYTKQPDDLTDSGSEEPLVPRQYRSMLADYGLAYLLDQKDDTRAGEILAIANMALAGMVSHNKSVKGRISGGNLGRIHTRPGNNGSLHGIPRTASGLYLR